MYLLALIGSQILYRNAFSPSRTQCHMHMTFRIWGFRVIFDPKSSFISLVASNSREVEGK